MKAFDIQDIFVECDLNAFDIIRNGSILANGEVLKDNGQVVDISGGCCKPEKFNKPKLRLGKLEPGPLGILLHSHDATYYHAMHEFGSRLQYVMDHCPRSNVEWLIRSSPVQRKIFALLDPQRTLRVTTFTVPRHAAYILIPPAPTRADSAAAFRATIVARAYSLYSGPPPPPAGVAPPHVLYVERIKSRAVLNAAELLASVMEFFPGVLDTYPDHGLPLHETVVAFAGASLVVGGHGAGLTNIIFCRRGAHLIEIVRREQGG